MLSFTPNYTVSYKGVFHKAGVAFEIDASDREEMSKHGAVDIPIRAEPVAEPVSEPVEDKPPAKKAGRPRKAVSV